MWLKLKKKSYYLPTTTTNVYFCREKNVLEIIYFDGVTRRRKKLNLILFFGDWKSLIQILEEEQQK